MRNKLGRLETSILDRLITHGYDAMVVGGAVRDWIIGRPFNDIDIATNAPYDKLIEIMDGLGELKFAGKQFGVLLVGGVEVATYRSEVCENNLVLDIISTFDMEEDSKRRDFTINAMYYDYATNKVVDYHDGYVHLVEDELIMAVGDPYKRFNEDYSRILRAMYLSATLEFEIELETASAIRTLGHNIIHVPNALIGKIVRKAIKDGCFHDFLKKLEHYDLLQYIFPDVTHLVGLPQNPKYHQHDAWNHTLEVVKHAELTRKGDVAFVMGAFLHDVAKGTEGIRGINKEGQPNDLNHEEAGVPIAKKICKRLELGKDIVNEVALYVEWHGAKMALTEKSVKHFLFKFKNNFRSLTDLQIGFYKLMKFQKCDAKAFEASFGEFREESIDSVAMLASSVFDKQIFYSNQFKFNAGVIANHPNVKQTEIREWIEFFIRNNIIEEEAVIKILDKQVLK